MTHRGSKVQSLRKRNMAPALVIVEVPVQRTLQEQQLHIYVRALVQRAAEAVAHVLLLVKVLLQRTLQEQ